MAEVTFPGTMPKSRPQTPTDETTIPLAVTAVTAAPLSTTGMHHHCHTSMTLFLLLFESGL